jgi:hypothetical protein
MGPGATLIVALVLGVAGGTLGWAMLRDTFAAPLFQRTNVRGADVPVGVGVLLPIVLVAAAALLVLGDRLEWVTLDDGALRTAVAAATGFGLLGLLDDLGGDASSKGFSGHLRALGRARLTTGAVKLFGGGAVAVLVASAGSDERPGRLLADAALIGLAANLANLLDRAPGRVAKVALVVAAPVALALNLLSERVSFSRVIDRTPPLRALDRLGRLP